MKSSRLICFVFCALLVACSKPPSVKKQVLMPARIDGLKQSKKIAFVNFKGDETGIYTQKIENYFRQVTVDNQPYFEVIEREALQEILDEQELSQSGLLDESTNLVAGNISGIDTLVMGSISVPQVETLKSREQRTDFGSCLVYRRDKKGRQFCSAYRKYDVDCFNQSVGVEFNIRFVSVETAKSPYQGNYSASSNNYFCSDKGSKIPNQRLKDIAFNKSVEKMRKDIAPYRQQVTIVLLDEDDGSELDDHDKALELFEKAIKLVENGNIDRGCSFFKQASSKYAKSPAIYYNLGVCAELQSNLSQALSFYEAAQNNIDEEPLPQIPKAINRIKQRMIDIEKVKQQSR